MIHKSGMVDGERLFETPIGPKLPPHDSERAAKYAFKFWAADLQELQDSVNPGGVITFEMLQALRRRLKGR